MLDLYALFSNALFAKTASNSFFMRAEFKETTLPIAPLLIHSPAQEVLVCIGYTPWAKASKKEVLMASLFEQPMYTTA